MQKINYYKDDGIFLARSSSTANTLFFERKNDHQLFFELIDKYLGGMIEVIHYSVVPTAWNLIFRTKSKEEIEAEYFRQRALSKKAKMECTKGDVEYMLSEHFRFMNSQLVKITNKRTGRHGTKVHSRFEKFSFENRKDMDNMIEQLETLVEFNRQWIEPYIPNYNLCDVEEMESEDDEFRSGKSYNKRIWVGDYVMKCFVKLLNQLDVVEKLIKSTFNRLFPKSPTPFPSVKPI